MAQYTIGNVTLKQNSATVVGASTDFLTASNVKVGDLFKRQGVNAWYQVSAVNAATNLNITPVYAQANASNVAYIIARDFTPNYNFTEMSSGDYDWPDIYTRAIRAIDDQVAAVAAAGGTKSVQVVTTATYYVQNADTIVVSSMAAGATASVWLPLATPARELKFAVSTGSMVVLASGSDTIEGNASIGLYIQYNTAALANDGRSTWYVF